MKLFLVLLLLSLTKEAASGRCPFDNGNNCDCNPDDSSPDDFSTVICTPQNGILNPFNGPSQYKVTQEFAIFSNFQNITISSSAFTSFSSISQLSFVNSAFSTVVSINLNPAAFNGVQIDTLSFSGLDVLPVPDAVRNAGMNGLTKLIIQNGKEASLDANGFQGFSSLLNLTINKVYIRNISDAAFVGLESTLQHLSLGPAAIYRGQFPKTALSKLTKLVFLDLSGNNINSWPEGAFERFAVLNELRLGTNDLQAAVNAGAFNHMPDTVQYLDISNGLIKDFPRTIFSNAHGLLEVNLGLNLIKTVGSTAFPDNLKLTRLDLSGNPIGSIDPNAFQPLKMADNLVLKQTEMKSIDLVVFNGMDKLKVLNLDYQRQYEFSLDASNPDLVPESLQKISLQNTWLKSISSSLAKIVGRPNFKKFDISGDSGLYCDFDLDWMAKYATCSPLRIITNGAMCHFAEESLKDYLHGLTPC